VEKYTGKMTFKYFVSKLDGTQIHIQYTSAIELSQVHV
jgi:hypothetical protein